MPSERHFHFPTTARLKRRADFQRVYRVGARVAGRYVVVFLMRADGHQGRFGVTASRRVGGAVVRSRCKRRLREVYRLHRDDFGEKPIDIVVNARRSAADAPWVALEEDFVRSVRRGLDLVSRSRRQEDREQNGASWGR